MGYQIFEQKINGVVRDAGYGVVAYCDHPNCMNTIDRGMSYACMGCHDAEGSCGGFYCNDHEQINFITECELDGLDDDEAEEYLADYGLTRDQVKFNEDGVYMYCEHPPIEHKDHEEWAAHVAKDESWDKWREENPEQFKTLMQSAEKWKQARIDQEQSKEN